MLLHPKKVGQLHLDDGTSKQTNEIKIAAPLLAPLNIDGIVITADALLTQREFARHLVEDRGAHYHFTVKANQKTLLEDVRYFFEQSKSEPDACETNQGHGRIETRKIWVTEKLNDYLDFPYVAQAFAIEREAIDIKTGHLSHEIVYGITSQPGNDAKPIDILHTNRGHWCIENSCHYILDWNYDEDRCRIRSGYGPENISRIRRFAIGVIKAISSKGVAETMRDLVMNNRMVFDYLKMTKNALGSTITG
ncbi:MAG: ISAs1 family transposase [Gammaproteobacteria bacterium]|nr:ISAs1 family transposase [Gammaproteobacteria bacterium]